MVITAMISKIPVYLSGNRLTKRNGLPVSSFSPSSSPSPNPVPLPAPSTFPAASHLLSSSGSRNFRAIRVNEVSISLMVLGSSTVRYERAFDSHA